VFIVHKPHRAAMTAEDTARALLARAQRRTFTLPDRGVSLAALCWGSRGPVVLLHHANGFSKGAWALVAEALQTRWRLIAIDARGHGDSTKPTGAEAYEWDHFALDLVAVAEQLCAEAGHSIALGIGHSFGGTSMIGAAARRGDLFERLLLVDPVIPPSPDAHQMGERPEYLERLVNGARGRRSHWPSRAAARAWCAERTLFAAWRPEAIELYLLDAMEERADGSLSLKCPGAIEGAVFGGSLRLDLPALARRVRTPARFLWAARGYFSRAMYEAIAASMASAAIHDVEAGHLVPMEEPELVAAAALECLG
jgi:pimeloyl-ACP methyl ester carboxylesterase